MFLRAASVRPPPLTAPTVRPPALGKVSHRASCTAPRQATSADPVGTYTRRGVTFPVFASEPDVALGPEGEAVMWFSASHPGAVPPGGPECTAGCTDGSTVRQCESNYTRGQTFTTWMSWAPRGDWSEAAWSTPVVIQEGTVSSQDTNMAVRRAETENPYYIYSIL